jgi:hypothetical protein
MALVDNAFYVNFGNGSSTGWFGVSVWATGASKVCGNLIRQLTVSPALTERCFVCIASTGGTGTTGGTEPTWSTPSRGQKFTDNTVTWQECSGIAALNGDLANTPSWTVVKNTAVTLGQVIKNVAGTLILICTTAGTAGNGAEPSWAAFTNAGATTADNTVTWTTLGASFSAWAAPHARLNNAYAANWGQAGNSFFFGDNSAETHTASVNLVNPGTNASPCFIYCCDHTVAPPTSANLKTTGTWSVTGASNLQFNGGYAYYYGITFTAGSATNQGNITLGAASSAFAQKMENCSMVLGGTNAASIFNFGNGLAATRVWLANTTLGFNNVSQAIVLNVNEFVWENTPSALVGSAVPTILFKPSAANGTSILRGVDLSAAGSGKTIVQGAAVSGFVNLVDCKLGASVTVAATTLAIGGTLTNVIRSDSSGTNYRQERYAYEATQTVETTIVRTGGASIEGTGQSWKIVTTANPKWLWPYKSPFMQVENKATGANVTVTVYGIWGTGSVPNNDDIWIEAEWLGSASFPLGSFINSTKANNLAAGSALSSDSSTWGGSTTPFKMSVTLSSPQPAQTGPINIRVLAAKPSTTFYIDPQPVLN